MADDDEGEQGESKKERVDRELIELLNEIRVALPGVQVLFAFLLAVPFANGWSKISPFQRDVYFVTLSLAALSSALLIAPSSQHRWLFRKNDKEPLLHRANWYTAFGMVFLAGAICSAILLVADYLFSRTMAVTYTAILAGVLGYLWLAVPLYRRITDPDK